MKKTIMTVALLLAMFCSTAHAADMMDSVCSTMKQSAAYQGGVDVHGNTVVPADLTYAGQLQLPEAIEIPMTVDMAQHLGVHLPTGGDLPASFGVFAVFTDGKVTYQGRDLTDNAKAVCHNREIGIEPAVIAEPVKAIPAQKLNKLQQTSDETIFTGEFE